MAGLSRKGEMNDTQHCDSFKSDATGGKSSNTSNDVLEKSDDIGIKSADTSCDESPEI